MDIGHADWSSQELSWDWSSVTLTYFARSQATIFDFRLTCLMKCYSRGLDVGYADWSSQELGWDRSSVTLTFSFAGLVSEHIFLQAVERKIK